MRRLDHGASLNLTVIQLRPAAVHHDGLNPTAPKEAQRGRKIFCVMRDDVTADLHNGQGSHVRRNRSVHAEGKDDILRVSRRSNIQGELRS